VLVSMSVHFVFHMLYRIKIIELELEQAVTKVVATHCFLPPETWSVYERTLNGDDSTNRCVEAANRRLQAEFGMDHPTILKFIDDIFVLFKNDVTACRPTSNSFVETFHLLNGESMSQLMPGSEDSLIATALETL